jgi:hypothetical protein
MDDQIKGRFLLTALSFKSSRIAARGSGWRKDQWSTKRRRQERKASNCTCNAPGENGRSHARYFFPETIEIPRLILLPPYNGVINEQDKVGIWKKFLFYTAYSFCLYP